jgi:hypothetical protein
MGNRDIIARYGAKRLERKTHELRKKNKRKLATATELYVEMLKVRVVVELV